MKKILVIVLALVMVFTFAACGGSSAGGTESSDFQWTRTGNFTNEAGDYAYIEESDMEDYPGWSVSFMSGEDTHGWFIPLEGETLHGDITSPDTEGDPYIVTVSEEGEDGIMIEVEGGETYHLTPMETPEFAGTLTINTEGMGEIAYAEGENAPEFEEGHPYTQAVVNILEAGKYTIAARTTEEGWKFVKWTRNGEDYSEDAQITVEITEDVDFTAVFE